MVVSGLRAECPSHLTLWRLSSWEMGICPVPSSSSAVEGPPVPRYRPIMRRMQEFGRSPDSCTAVFYQGYRIRNTGYGIRDTRYEIQSVFLTNMVIKKMLF